MTTPDTPAAGELPQKIPLLDVVTTWINRYTGWAGGGPAAATARST